MLGYVVDGQAPSLLLPNPPTHAGARRPPARAGSRALGPASHEPHILHLAATSPSSITTAGQAGLRSLAIALGGGLGAVGAGVGIGTIFKAVIEATTRQPEMRPEITSLQWLGFALTEAVFFYGLVAGLLAFVL